MAESYLLKSGYKQAVIHRFCLKSYNNTGSQFFHAVNPDQASSWQFSDSFFYHALRITEKKVKNNLPLQVKYVDSFQVFQL